ncbi:MAG: hypothetical protein RL205_321, partial [Actinomycetota bacterium]
MKRVLLALASAAVLVVPAVAADPAWAQHSHG